MLGQCKPQSCSGFVGTGVCTVESGEDVRELHFVHAGAVVGNVDYPVFVVLSDVDQDGAAFGTVVDGVADDVVEGAVQVAFVGKDGCVFGDFSVGRQGNRLSVFLGNALIVFYQVAQEGQEFQAFFFQSHIGSFETGQG